MEHPPTSQGAFVVLGIIRYDNAAMPEHSNNEPRAPGPNLARVLASAARLQAQVPDAVLVGGSAAALYAGHRESMDHDHVLSDLAERFDVVLEALEATEGWVTNRVVPGKIILGAFGDIEAGVRQMRRKIPLETARYELPDGQAVSVPTWGEALRIKGYLIVRRNQVRDYLDVAALADAGGLDEAAAVLAHIDDYYADQHESGDGVASQLARQLSEPQPADHRVTRELDHYKGLKDPWQNWHEVVQVCQDLAQRMLETDD